VGKLLIIKTLLQQGKLAWRLLRDPRVPVYAKAVLGATLLYVFSPLDLVPDWIPLLGQLDDLAILTGGLALFVRLCPDQVVEEHERELGQRPRRTIDGRGESLF
jgi:uncharacterized membrane protein YkvA (DUF1232 family)